MYSSTLCLTNIHNYQQPTHSLTYYLLLPRSHTITHTQTRSLHALSHAQFTAASKESSLPEGACIPLNPPVIASVNKLNNKQKRKKQEFSRQNKICMECGVHINQTKIMTNTEKYRKHSHTHTHTPTQAKKIVVFMLKRSVLVILKSKQKLNRDFLNEKAWRNMRTHRRHPYENIPEQIS